MVATMQESAKRGGGLDAFTPALPPQSAADVLPICCRYVHHRDALLALLYLGCAVNQVYAMHSSSSSSATAALQLPEGLAALLQGVLAPLMLFSACQARPCQRLADKECTALHLVGALASSCY